MADSRITQFLVTGKHATDFSVVVEPEGMEDSFPPQERLLLTFRGPDLLPQFEISHRQDALTVWRPGDTEVSTTLADGRPRADRRLL